jgi:hypothetical protein
MRLNTDGDSEQLARSELDIAVAQSNHEPIGPHQEEVVRVVIMVPVN